MNISKPDYKKTYFEKQLNDNKKQVTSLFRRMKQFGYHYVCENGHYYVYSSYEWKVKQEFDHTVKPLFDTFLETSNGHLI
jgi:hypothetical protein